MSCADRSAKSLIKTFLPTCSAINTKMTEYRADRHLRCGEKRASHPQARKPIPRRFFVFAFRYLQGIIGEPSFFRRAHSLSYSRDNDNWSEVASAARRSQFPMAMTKIRRWRTPIPGKPGTFCAQRKSLKLRKIYLAWNSHGLCTGHSSHD